MALRREDGQWCRYQSGGVRVCLCVRVCVCVREIDLDKMMRGCDTGVGAACLVSVRLTWGRYDGRRRRPARCRGHLSQDGLELPELAHLERVARRGAVRDVVQHGGGDLGPDPCTTQ